MGRATTSYSGTEVLVVAMGVVLFGIVCEKLTWFPSGGTAQGLAWTVPPKLSIALWPALPPSFLLPSALPASLWQSPVLSPGVLCLFFDSGRKINRVRLLCAALLLLQRETVT